MSALKLTTAPTQEPVTLAEAKDQCRVDTSITIDDSYISGLITAARQYVENITGRCLVSQQWLLAMDFFPDRRASRLPFQEGPFYLLPPFFTVPMLPLDEDPRAIVLPLAPLIRVDSLKTVDSEGTEATFAASNYVVDDVSEPGRLVLKDGVSWPVPDAGLAVVNGVRVLFTSGYGADAGLVAARAALSAAEALVAAAVTAPEIAAAQVALASAAADVTEAEADILTAIPADLKTAVKLLVAHLYSNREAVTDIKFDTLPLGVRSYLANYRMWQRKI